MKTVTRSPALFRLAKKLIRNNLRGGYRLIDTCQKLGLFDVEVRHELAPGISIDVPIYREATPWDEADVRSYEAAHVNCLAAAASRLPGPVLFLDCGADIGTFSLLMAMTCRIDRIVAFEPNPVAYDVLQKNLARLPLPTDPRRAAVSDFVGAGELVQPREDPSEHACFVMEAPNGDVPVMRIDDLDIRWEDYSVVLRLDVEGSELAALRGAREALTRARAFAVSVEAHRMVSQRTGRLPSACIRFLRGIRDCDVTVSEAPHVELGASGEVFDQLGGKVYNVVCESRGEGRARGFARQADGMCAA